MHTRRIAAFIVGAWLVGALLVWFAKDQSSLTVHRTLIDPPVVLQKFIEEQGEFARLLMRFQAGAFGRHLTESWEVVQLGLAGALLATALLTSHRSRILVTFTAVLVLLTAGQFWLVTKPMHVLSRDVDFAHRGNTAGAMDQVADYMVWHRVLEIMKLAIVSGVAARLLVDLNKSKLPFVPQRRTRPRKHKEQAAPDSKEASAAVASVEDRN